MGHTATMTKLGRIAFRTVKPDESRIVLRLIRITGKAIAKLRKEFNLNQEELAEKMGVSQSLISLMERGKHVPDERQIIFLQDLFSRLSGYKIILYFDRPPEEQAQDPDEYYGVKA